jgi:threonine aldolase
MNFLSDTTAPAHPAVTAALIEVNHGREPSYGADQASGRLERLISDLCGTEVACLPVVSGTAANALALSVLCSPMGSVACHTHAHIAEDERGAPEFFTGGGKLRLLEGANGQISLDALHAALRGNDPSFVHATPIEALSLTNLTESGTAYSPLDIAARAAAAHAAGLKVHLDGARLANALASTGASLAEMTVAAGIDVLSLGLTKTGALGCEVIVLFGDARAWLPELRARAKRAGHLPPKMRFLATQAEALLADGLWLELAATANAHAKRLAEGLSALGWPPAYPVQGNEVFVALPAAATQRLKAAGAGFYPWHDGTCRFVTAWNTQESEVAGLLAALSAA